MDLRENLVKWQGSQGGCIHMGLGPQQSPKSQSQSSLLYFGSHILLASILHSSGSVIRWTPGLGGGKGTSSQVQLVQKVKSASSLQQSHQS